MMEVATRIIVVGEAEDQEVQEEAEDVVDVVGEEEDGGTMSIITKVQVVPAVAGIPHNNNRRHHSKVNLIPMLATLLQDLQKQLETKEANESFDGKGN
jgi:hypothetical protein